MFLIFGNNLPDKGNVDYAPQHTTHRRKVHRHLPIYDEEKSLITNFHLISSSESFRLLLGSSLFRYY